MNEMRYNTSTQLQCLCTTLRREELSEMFPLSDHEESGSAAILNLSLITGSGALRIGSRDPGRFAQGHGHAVRDLYCRCRGKSDESPRHSMSPQNDNGPQWKERFLLTLLQQRNYSERT